MWPLKTDREAVRTPRAKQTLLAILPDPADRDAVNVFASTNNWILNVIGAVEPAIERLSHGPVPVVLIDRDVPEQDWRLSIRTLVSRNPSPCVILVSAVVDLYLFDEVVHHGGYDVLSKPLRNEQLRRTLGLAFTFWKHALTRSVK
jgi:DNA-binding NtrC family response regulator